MSAGALIAPPLRRLEASLPRSSCRVWAAERASPVQGVLCLEPPGAVSRGHAPCRGGARPGSGGAQGRCLVRPGLLADTAVDPLAEQIGVAEVAGVLLDHVEYHLAQRDGRAVLHRAADGEVG